MNLIAHAQAALDRLPRPATFARNVAILALGTAMAQALPILATPLMARLYRPDDFGLLAVFTSCTTVLSILATGRYEIAITLPKSTSDAANLVLLTLKVCASACALFLLPLLIFSQKIATVLGNEKLSIWLPLVPAAAFSIATFNTLQLWFNRAGNYKEMAASRFGSSIINTISSLSLGILGWSSGQILSSVATPLISIIIAGRTIWRSDKKIFAEANYLKQRLLAQRYISHPFHLLPAQLMGATAIQIPILLFSSVYSPSTAGFFSIAYRLVTLPTLLVANAIGDVFRQRIATEYQNTGSFHHHFLKTLKYTSLAALPVFSLFYLTVPSLIDLTLGPQWDSASEYAQALIVSSFFQFIFTPIDKCAVLVGATRYIFFWHLSRLLLLVSLYLFASTRRIDEMSALWIFVAINAVLYLTEGIAGFHLSKGNRNEQRFDQ